MISTDPEEVQALEEGEQMEHDGTVCAAASLFCSQKKNVLIATSMCTTYKNCCTLSFCE